MKNERHRPIFFHQRDLAQAKSLILNRLKDNIETTFSELDRSIVQSVLPIHIKDELLTEKKSAYDIAIRHLYSMYEGGERNFKSLHNLLKRLNVSRREIIEANGHTCLEPILGEVKIILNEMQDLPIFV